MCKHGTLTTVKLNRPRKSGRKEVPVDACIADEIQMLNNIGVITYGCCCGHGQFEPECLVDISSKDLLVSKGYKLRVFSEEHSDEGIYEILLKTQTDEEEFE